MVTLISLLLRRHDCTRESGAPRVRRVAPSRPEPDLADVAAVLDVSVRRRRFRETKRAVDDGVDLAQRLPFQDMFHPAPQQAHLAPEMADIDTEDAAIVIHQPQWI